MERAQQDSASRLRSQETQAQDVVNALQQQNSQQMKAEASQQQHQVNVQANFERLSSKLAATQNEVSAAKDAYLHLQREHLHAESKISEMAVGDDCERKCEAKLMAAKAHWDKIYSDAQTLWEQKYAAAQRQ